MSKNVASTKQPNPRLSKEREAEIGDLAEYLSTEKFSNLRVEPKAIAEAKGIEIIAGHYEDAFDGMLEHDQGRFFIYCNLDRLDSLTTPRARFTIAHELGHFLIDEHRNALKSGQVPKHPSHCDHESKNPIELEADHFASSLLMPSEKFRKRTKRLESGLTGIMELASEFGTSLTSTAIRHAKLDLSTCVIIKWDADGYGWKWLSPSAYQIGWRKTIEESARLVHGSATEKILNSNSNTTEIVRSGTTAAHWFPFIRMGGRDDLVLVEEAISLGRFGALTYISEANLR